MSGKKAKAARKVQAAAAPAPVLKLDLGCGKRKQEGFIGVDCRPFEGVDVVADLSKRWPWADNSVDEVYTSHMVEHLNAEQRIHFVNELYRVLKPDGTCTLIVPHWGSCRAYGDLTHQWPPVSEFWFFYLSAAWRATEAPHNDAYICDFEATWGYGIRQDLLQRSQEMQQFALQNYRDAITDIYAKLVKRVAKEGENKQ